MLDNLPKLKKEYEFQIKDVENCIKALDEIEYDEITIFVIPSKVNNNKIEIDPSNFYGYIPIFKKFDTPFSQDREASFKMLKMMMFESIDEGFDDLIFGYGSLEKGLEIDGQISNISRLSDSGMTIVDAYLTSKRDSLYYSEEVFENDINDLVNEIILSKTFNSMIDLTDLKSYIQDLKEMVKFNKLHKKTIEYQTLKVRESFYERIDVEEIEREKDIDLFLTCADLLHFMGILDVFGTTMTDNKRFDYFKEEAFRESLNVDEYSLNVEFNERFLKIFG